MLVLRLIVGTIGELQLKYECERTAWSRDIVMDMFYGLNSRWWENHDLERRLQSHYMLVLRLIVGTIGELQLKYECQRTAWCRVIAFPLNLLREC